MTAIQQAFEVRVSGFWNTTHRIFAEGEELGVLTVSRGLLGQVKQGRYVPREGKTLVFARDPGLVRCQFSVWDEDREWQAASLRWNPLRRNITVYTSNKPLRLGPRPELGFGWTLSRPRAGEMARILTRPGGRRSRLEVSGQLKFELLLFAYFLGFQTHWESLWPGEMGSRAPGS